MFAPLVGALRELGPSLGRVLSIDPHEATVLDGALLEPAMQGHGRAVIETAGTTVVVRPDNRFEVDRFGNIHIEIDRPR